MKININALVKVKLTQTGEARYKGLMGLSGEYNNLEMPLWELMEIFGPGLHMGMIEMYFENNEIEIYE
jgi:hypothetical protein